VVSLSVVLSAAVVALGAPIADPIIGLIAPSSSCASPGSRC